MNSRVGSLEKAGHRPGGGKVRIENRKLEWSAGSKVGSLKNASHRAGGGNVQIHSEKPDWQVVSRVGSLKNVRHRPGGGEKKIFDDKDYLKQMSEVGLARHSSGSSSLTGSTWDSSKLEVEPTTTTTTAAPLRSKRSVAGPGSSFQSQIVRKLVRSETLIHIFYVKSQCTDHVFLQSPMSAGY